MHPESLKISFNPDANADHVPAVEIQFVGGIIHDSGIDPHRFAAAKDLYELRRCSWH